MSRPHEPRLQVVDGLDAQDSVHIGVADRGQGCPAEMADSQVDRFFRAEGPPRAGREGLGIGLALARELTELRGGRIGTAATAELAIPDIQRIDVRVLVSDVKLPGMDSVGRCRTLKAMPVSRRARSPGSRNHSNFLS